MMDTAKHLYKVQPPKPGYPVWYQALCPKPEGGGFAQPSDLSASKAVVPKLLRLCWKGFPLHRYSICYLLGPKIHFLSPPGTFNFGLY